MYNIEKKNQALKISKTYCLLFKSSSEDGIRPEEELGDLIQQSLLPGPNLEVTTGTWYFGLYNSYYLHIGQVDFLQSLSTLKLLH